MNGDDRGLLGNLPRSRPGTRSEKRGGAPSAEESPASPKPAEPAAGDPVGDALRTAARTAEAGLRTAGDVTREILRRLPRP
jgi:hypothetical protein